LPELLADQLSVADLFDSAIFRTERDLQRTIAKLAFVPELTDAQRRKIAAEWQDNVDLWIKGFAEEEIQSLRVGIQKATLAGNRYELAIKAVQKSYGVTAAKAKFLARQETNLLVTKLKETRYLDAGVVEYRWRCVAGSKHHPVRPSHKILDGKLFRWSDPPITSAPDEPARRNNPGQDYNCRCIAIPVVRFKRALAGEED
jgi:SPP1 gp7 family putative phage head morphogenesis protein